MSEENKENGMRAVDFAQNVALNYTEVYNGILELRRATKTHPNSKPTQGPPVRALQTQRNKHDGTTPRTLLNSRNLPNSRKMAVGAATSSQPGNTLHRRDQQSLRSSKANGARARHRRSLSMEPRRNHSSLNETPVFERLLALGNQKQDRLEKLRSSLSAVELNGQFEPQINPRSRKMMNRPSDVSAQLLEFGRNRSRKVEKQRTLLEQQELSQLRAVPAINKRSARIARNQSRSRQDIADRTAVYAQSVKCKTQRLRAQLDRQEVAELQNAPQINERSNRMVKQRSVEDMMHWDAMRQEKIDFERSRQRYLSEASLNFAPKLSQGSRRISKRLNRSGSVGERLYNRGARANSVVEDRLREHEKSGGINASRRRTQSTSGMKRSESSGSLQPGWMQRVLNWEARILSDESNTDHGEGQNRTVISQPPLISTAPVRRENRPSTPQFPTSNHESVTSKMTNRNKKQNETGHRSSPRRPSSAPVRAPSGVSPAEDDDLLRSRAEKFMNSSQAMAKYAGLCIQ